MQITASWGAQEVAVDVDAECRTLAALKALLQDALPELDVGRACLKVGGCELTADDDVCGLEAQSVVEVAVTAAALAESTLREEGADVDLTGFCRAAREGDVRRCQLYLDAGVRCPPGAANPLHVACRGSHLEVVELLLAGGFSLSQVNPYGETPLHACLLCSMDVVRFLLDRGVPVDECRLDGYTALHAAVSNEHVEVATLLLDRGAAVDWRSPSGSTPLHSACLHNNVDLARLLLDRGFAVDATSRKGDTPLHLACHFNDDCAEVVTLLLERGAAPDAANSFGDTPLSVACNDEVKALLLAHGRAVASPQ